MDAKRRNRQQKLPFAAESRGEALRAAGEGAEAPMAKSETERPAETTEHLVEEVCERKNLEKALRRVQVNKGSSGVDGMTVRQLPGHLREHWLEVKSQLLGGTYKPAPVKRVEIPKPGGGVRKLGIPTVLDRFIQQAILQVLQPRWNRTFSRAATDSVPVGRLIKP